MNIYIGPENTHWILHERLLCYHSPFFARIFYSKDSSSSSSKNYGFPDADDAPFELFVGWLYSRALRGPSTERDTGALLDLYFLSQTLEIQPLGLDVIECLRGFYHTHSTYPSLRRVQYVYANTETDNELREMMVGSVARFLALGDAIPKHWEHALKQNGQLSVDIIRSIQRWHLDEQRVPDVRDFSQDRGRSPAETKKKALAAGLGFSDVKDKSEPSDEDKGETPIKEEPTENGSHVGGLSNGGS